MQLSGIQLKIQNPIKTLAFYTDILGFSHIKTIEKENQKHYVLQAKNTNFLLELIHNSKEREIENYQELPQDNYWKYSLFVDDITRTATILNKLNIAVNEPFQFGNIGYLAHIQDTENHKIEFIQKTFKQHTPKKTPTSKHPLQELPIFGLITIRSKDPVKSIQFYEKVLHMKLFVRMYVERGNGFTLYFLGDKNLTPPNPDIDALENREWMYQQKHCFIEIQHYWGTETNTDFNLKVNPLGLQKIILTSNNLENDLQILSANNISFSKEKEGIVFFNNDEHQFLLR